MQCSKGAGCPPTVLLPGGEQQRNPVACWQMAEEPAATGSVQIAWSRWLQVGLGGTAGPLGFVTKGGGCEPRPCPQVPRRGGWGFLAPVCPFL